MLQLPFKKSDHTIDLAGPVKRYLITHFGEDAATRYSSDIDALQNLRHRATIVEAPTTAGRDALTVYYHAITRINPIFPIGDTSEVKVGFSWSGSFVPTKKSSQSTLHFERVCVLYNIGALESHGGAQCDRNSDEGLREACKHFQLAAGIFSHIRDSLSNGLVGALTPDLTPDGLSAAASLMLAQAQACFYEKAARDVKKGVGMKPKIVSKLAAGAQELYSQALERFRSASLAPVLDKTWAAATEYQVEAFGAFAHYWAAVAAHDEADAVGQGYGMEIARYSLAEEAIERANKLANRGSMGPAITGPITQLQGQVSRGKAVIVKDNQRIYLEPVPALNSVPAPDRHIMVSATATTALEPPVATGGAAGSALFRGLLPLCAKSALDAYKSAVAKLAAEEDTRVKEANKVARAELAAVGLPGSLEAHDSQGGLPDGVWARLCDAKKRTGGLPSLCAKVDDVSSAAERARNILETVKRSLDQEERRDEEFRARYGGKCTGLGSRELAKDVRKDVEHYRDLWQRANASDRALAKRLAEPATEQDLELLEMTRAEIDARMAAAAAEAGGCGGAAAAAAAKGDGSTAAGAGTGEGASAPASLAVDTSALSMRLVGLAQLINERDAALQQLQDRATNEDVGPLLMEAAMAGGGDGSPATYAAVTQGALAAYEPLRQQIAANVERQPGLLASIMEENGRFVRAKAADAVTLAREAFLQRLHRGQDVYFELHAQLSEGSGFYGDLLRRLAQLNQRSEDLCYTQSVQRRDFEVQFSHQEERARQQAQDEELARHMAAGVDLRGAGPTAAAGSPPAAPPAGPVQYPPSYPTMQQQPGQYNPYNRPLPQTPQMLATSQAPGGGGGNPFSAPAPYVPLPGYQGGYGGQNGGWPPQLQQPPQQQPMPQFVQQQHQQYNQQPLAPHHPPPQQPQQPQQPSYYEQQSAAAPGMPPQQAQQGFYLPPGYNQSGMDPKVARMVEMGFPVERARNALSACGGDQEAAVSKLLSEG